MVHIRRLNEMMTTRPTGDAVTDIMSKVRLGMKYDEFCRAVSDCGYMLTFSAYGKCGNGELVGTAQFTASGKVNDAPFVGAYFRVGIVEIAGKETVRIGEIVQILYCTNIGGEPDENICAGTDYNELPITIMGVLTDIRKK